MLMEGTKLLYGSTKPSESPPTYLFYGPTAASVSPTKLLCSTYELV